jgi:hypothetical protein
MLIVQNAQQLKLNRPPAMHEIIATTNIMQCASKKPVCVLPISYVNIDRDFQNSFTAAGRIEFPLLSEWFPWQPLLFPTVADEIKLLRFIARCKSCRLSSIKYNIICAIENFTQYCSYTLRVCYKIQQPLCCTFDS